jgi:chromosome partitioning protein
VYQALLGDASLADSIRPSGVAGLDLIPSEVDLAVAEVDVARTENYLQRLRHALNPIHETGQYDFLFVDCPPSLGILTMNALAAVDRVFVPIQCEYFALEGLAVIMRVIQQIKDSGANPGLEIEGVALTMYDGRTRLAEQVADEVRKHLGPKVFETVIPRTVRLAEAPSHGRPITQYDPHSAGATAYRLLTDELLARAKANHAVSQNPDQPAGTGHSQPQNP